MSSELRDLFKSIRDIPYRVPLTLHEKDYACVGKNQKLKAELEKQGFEVRWRVCEFHWSDLPIPKKILTVPHEDEAQHAYLEVQIDDIWQAVDASWDIGLASTFNIADWDGTDATPIAVPCLKVLSPEESSYTMSGIDEGAIKKDLIVSGEFYKALNQWLEQVRNATVSS